MSQLVLSLFPGIGLLDRAFEEEGFCIVRGPDVLWGGDIRRFHPPAGRFEGVIGGPPCQAFSRLAFIVRANGYEPKFGNLIPDFERVVQEASPDWFLMENVPDAPLPGINEYGVHSFLINNRQCLDAQGKPASQNRVRRWSFGSRGARRLLMIDTCAMESMQFEYAATSAGRGAVPVAIGGSGKPKRNRIGRLVEKDVLSQGTQRSQAGFVAVRELQGLPCDFDLPPFTVEAKVRAVANGVPLPMGRAIARAVFEATKHRHA
jgi:DNA (cytosine-5)-methyltransferase 1